MTSRFSRLSTADLINLSVEAADTPMHVGVLAIVDGRSLCDDNGTLQLDALRRRLDRLLDAAPELRRIAHHAGPLAGPPIWVDDPHFRIDRHVNRVDLPPPSD
jgi:diacylglycerol O-acyltransferase / wax synthase